MDVGILTLLWNALIGAAFMMGGWLWSSLNRRMNDIDNRHTKAIEAALTSHQRSIELQGAAHDRMQDLVTNIQINYVHKNELREMKRDLLDRFDRLESYFNRGERNDP